MHAPCPPWRRQPQAQHRCHGPPTLAAPTKKPRQTRQGFGMRSGQWLQHTRLHGRATKHYTNRRKDFSTVVSRQATPEK